MVIVVVVVPSADFGPAIVAAMKKRMKGTIEFIVTFSQTNDIMLYPSLQGHLIGCRTGNGDQLSSNQAEPGQAINSAVAYFPSISCATSCPLAL